MYVPKHFLQDDTERCFNLIKENPLALIVCNADNGIEAHHIPLLVTQTGDTPVLIGHVAKANTLWEIVKRDSNMLVVFQGVEHYISPNYYATKKESPKVVPTWNYCAVHINANVTVHHDAKWKLAMLNALTDENEAKLPSAWKVDDAPSDFVEKQMAGIVGIELHVTKMVGKWKVSQNKPQRDQVSVIDALSTSSEYAQQMADEVGRYKKDS